VLVSGRLVVAAHTLSLMATNCPFCDRSALDHRIVHTGACVRVVVPREPATDRHFLLIPMAHRREFCDLSSAELAELQELMRLLRDRLRTSQSVGYTLLSNNGGLGADQHVARYHFTSSELLEHCASIRQALGS
jgi:diadenosine tetraphosphate (Ap4A) HIT family hydrolase